METEPLIKETEDKPNHPKKIFSIVKCPDAIKQRCNSDFGAGLMTNYFTLEKANHGGLGDIIEENFDKYQIRKQLKFENEEMTDIDNKTNRISEEIYNRLGDYKW
jgi:hypothetical protein